MRDRQPDHNNNHWGSIRKSTQEILNVRQEIRARESPAARLVDQVGRGLVRPTFLLTMLLGHAFWVAVNLPVVPWQPWDPYPFVFLATVASVEAPFLALLVLMHQQREQRINELREETSLQVALHIERETTMLLRLIRELHAHQGVASDQDAKLLERMKEFMDPEELMGTLQQDLRRDEDDEASALLP